MVHFDAPYLTVHWNNVVGCVVMEWKRFVEGADFRNGLNTGLELLKNKRATRWLADLRHLGVVTQEDQDWSNQNWFPRARAAGMRSMAIVVPENIIAKWSVDRIVNRVEGTNIQIHYFDNLEQALTWLQSH